MGTENTAITLDDDLDNLSAEDLEALIEQDDGQATMGNDDQNFTIAGIDDLNNHEAGDEETPPTEEAEETTGELLDDAQPPAPAEPETPPVEEPTEPVVDYQAKYNAMMERLAQQKLLDDAQPPAPAEPETPPDTRSLYDQTMDKVNLSPEEQTKYDSYKEYDEDQADMYQTQIKQKKIVENMLELQQKNEAEKVQTAENTRKSQEQEYTNAINNSNNMKNWQSDQGTWDDVNAMHSRMFKDPDYAKLSTAEQMTKLEQRFAKFSDVESDTKPPTPVVPETEASKVVGKKIAEVENKSAPPSSLSSISGGNSNQKPGEIKLDNSSDGADIQLIMNDLAESDDPEAIDKFLSSINFG